MDRETAIRKGIQKTIERTITPEAPKEKQSKKRRAIPWAAILGPVIFAGIIGAGYLAYQNSDIEVRSGLYLMEYSRTNDDKAPAVEIPAEEKKVSPPETEVAVSPASSASEATNPKEDENSVAQIYPYHIIVGSFKASENAQSYISQLQAKGYDSYMANGQPNFHRVAIGNFATKAQAREALVGIRQNIQSGAWIYSN
ncbi:MAG: SPOR domain-containing protein [Owenweeksia sp.]|nr:SPOR domain-containing protein [Owenweeksia sp.]